MKDEFYIGWEKKASPDVARFIRLVVAALMLAAIILPEVLAVSQRTIGTSVFEYGTTKHFTGIFRVWPYPHLLVPRPGGIGASQTYSAYFLVAPWKFGLRPEAIKKFDGKFVTLHGTLIYRDTQTMIQVDSVKIEDETGLTVKSPLPEATALGMHTFVGEIVDSKCYFGVMNPGQLTPHRACAILCINGGIPPVLLVREKAGPPLYLFLVSADGRPVNQQVLDYVAEPVRISGEVERQDGFLILRADPATYQRVKPQGDSWNPEHI